MDALGLYVSLDLICCMSAGGEGLRPWHASHTYGSKGISTKLGPATVTLSLWTAAGVSCSTLRPYNLTTAMPTSTTSVASYSAPLKPAQVACGDQFGPMPANHANLLLGLRATLVFKLRTQGIR